MQPQTIDQISANLAKIYDPQTALIKQQQAALPSMYNAQTSALEQARINAFRDIGNQASARGMTFSGFTPEQQAQYTGTKYLPAMAEIKNNMLTQQNSLTDALNKLNASRYSQAYDIYNAQQKAIADAQAKVQAARVSASSKAATTTASNAAKYKVKQGSQGQYFFTSPNGTPISMGEFVVNSGGDMSTIYNLLRNGTAWDRANYNNIANKRMTDAQAYDYLRGLKNNVYGLE